MFAMARPRVVLPTTRRRARRRDREGVAGFWDEVLTAAGVTGLVINGVRDIRGVDHTTPLVFCRPRREPP